MKKEISFSEMFGDYLIPTKLRKSLRGQLEILGIRSIPFKSIAYAFYIDLIISMLTGFLISRFIFADYHIFLKIMFGFISFLAMSFIIWRLVFLIYRTIFDTLYSRLLREIDRALPVFLIELNLHLKSGTILIKAIKETMKPEIGYLNNVLKEVNRDINLGYEASKAFRKATEKYRSEHLKEVFNLIAKSEEDGGKTITLIDNLINNLNTSVYLQDETEASVGSYVLFIKIIALVVSPVLFATSYYVLMLIKNVIIKFINSGVTEKLGIFNSELTINSTQFLIFAVLATIISASGASYIIGLMKAEKKDIRTYIKYVLFSILSFIVAFYVMGGVFGDIQL